MKINHKLANKDTYYFAEKYENLVYLSKLNTCDAVYVYNTRREHSINDNQTNTQVEDNEEETTFHTMSNMIQLSKTQYDSLFNMNSVLAKEVISDLVSKSKRPNISSINDLINLVNEK